MSDDPSRPGPTVTRETAEHGPLNLEAVFGRIDMALLDNRRGLQFDGLSEEIDKEFKEAGYVIWSEDGVSKR